MANEPKGPPSARQTTRAWTRSDPLPDKVRHCIHDLATRADKTDDLRTIVLLREDREALQRLHNRMPVILQPKDYDRWLTPGDPEQPPVDLLRPFPAEQMTAWKVDRKVGSVKNDAPDCIEPMSEPRSHEPGLFR